MKKILITGANQGLGLQYIKNILTKNLPYQICATSRTKEKFEKSLKELEKQKLETKNIKNYILDLDKKDSVENLVDKLKSNNEQLDVLVNNAGVLSWKMKHDYEHIMRVNFTNTKLLTEKILNQDLVNKNGKIIFMQGLLGNINDIPKQIQDDFLSDMDLDELNQKIIDNYQQLSKNDKMFTTSYRASKLLIAKYIQQLVKQQNIQEKNIQVYGIHPGWVRTNMGTQRGPISVEQGAKPFDYILDLPFEVNSEYQGMIFGKKKEVLDVLDKKVNFHKHF